MPYTVVQSAFDGFFPRGQLQSYWKSTYLTELSDGVIDSMAERAQQRPTGRSELELAYFDIFPMGGAVRRVGPEATAFSERRADYLVAVDGNWSDGGEDDEQIGWVRESAGTVAEFGTGSTYLNFSGRDGEGLGAGVDDALGRNLRRLSDVKAAYDPDNLFHRNNNIRATPEGGES